MNLSIFKSNLHDGSIQIKGYKHSLVQIIAAAIALNQKTLIKNVPLVDDTYILQSILQNIGCIFDLSDNEIFLDSSNLDSANIDENLSKKIHGSVYLLPALAIRLSKFEYSGSGGCQIGSSSNNGERPYKHIIGIIQSLGFTPSLNDNQYHFNYHNIKSSQINIMDYSDDKEELIGELISSATKTAIIMSTFQDHFQILNPYLKNDVQDLLAYLQCCGYIVKQTPLAISIKRSNDKKDIVVFELSDCISEIISYTTLAVMSDISLKLRIKNSARVINMLENELNILSKMGISLSIRDNIITIEKPKEISACDIIVNHKTILSDHHPFFALMLSKAKDVSKIIEYVWKERFKYIEELKKIGIYFDKNDNQISIYPSKFKNSKISLDGCDTRATALLIIAALNTPGNTEIIGAEHLLRGYDSFIENIRKLGGCINIFEDAI